jgi:hypothetical protein
MTKDDVLYGLIESFADWLRDNDARLNKHLGRNKVFHFDLRVMVDPKDEDVVVHDNGQTWGVC